MPRAPRSKQVRHDPLHVEIAADESPRKFGRAKNRKSKVEQEEVEDEPRTGEDARMSRKILELAREQQDEVANELGEDDDDMWKDEDEDEELEPSARPRQAAMSSEDEDDEEGSDIEGSDEEHELNIDPEDHATMDALGKEEGAGKTLADLIFAQMSGAPAAPVEDDGPPDPRQGLNPKVVEVYTK